MSILTSQGPEGQGVRRRHERQGDLGARTLHQGRNSRFDTFTNGQRIQSCYPKMFNMKYHQTKHSNSFVQSSFSE